MRTVSAAAHRIHDESYKSSVALPQAASIAHALVQFGMRSSSAVLGARSRRLIGTIRILFFF